MASGLQAVMQGGEAIPREYHRKILKKVAQLTKVVHLLNTKNDEHEAFVQKLRSLQETEIERVLKDSASRLQGSQEEAMREREAGEKREEEVRSALREVMKERDQLLETQMSYWKEVGERLGELQTEHTQQVNKLTAELQRLKGEQSRQVKEVSELKDRFARKTGEQVKSLKDKHEREIQELARNGEMERQKHQKDLFSLRGQHQNDQECLRREHKLELDGEREKLRQIQNKLVSEEAEKRQEVERSLRQEFTEREESLKQQVSDLSSELRVTKDKLALAEQRVREMELYSQEDKEDSNSLKDKLQAAVEEREQLKSTVRSLESEVEIAREQYRLQAVEMQGLSASLAKLEAVRVSQQGEIGELQTQLSGLREKLGWLEGERKAMMSSQNTTSQQQSERIKALEKELERVGREKREMRAQYAREIEAAHSQLGERETELGAEHIKVLQEQRDRHHKDLEEERQEHENALEELRQRLEAAARQEIQGIIGQHGSEVAALQDSIASKTSELESVRLELETLRLAMSERDKGLGSATEQVEKLRVELGRSQEELRRRERAWEESRKENTELKSSVKTLRAEQVQSLQRHREELQTLKASLTEQLEQKWMQRIKQECASLRLELSQRHSDDSRSALSELASLKDAAFREARDEWEKERDGLLRKIEELNHQLEDLHLSASASVEEAKNTAGEVIMSLRQQLEEERSRSVVAEKEMRRVHQTQLQTQQLEHEVNKKHLVEELSSQHQSELQSVRQSNQLAVRALREQMDRKKREELELTASRHNHELAALHAELASLQEAELARLREAHEAEIQAHQREIQELINERKRTESMFESTLSSVRGEVATRDTDLSQLRDRLNTLTVTVNGLRKELEVRGQEVAAARREAKNVVRLREQQLSSAHQAELESLGSQHRHQSQLLLNDFNRAKEMLNAKIAEQEKRLSESERRYRSRDSKPEDIQTIKELRFTVQEQERKMKELVAEKRIYQLELMNREKNYNKLFNANPHVGVMDPLQFKRKLIPESSGAVRHASAPSLACSSADFPHQAMPLPLEPKRPPELEASHHPVEPRHRKLVLLQDSPLSQKKLGNSRTASGHNVPLHPTPPSVSPPKQTMFVQ